MEVSTQALGNSTTLVANTQFVQNALQNSYDGLLGLVNTWSANQNFITQSLGDSSLLVATTAFVQNALTNFLASANTFTLVQTFSGGIVPNYTPSASNTGVPNRLGFSYATSTIPAAQALTSNGVKNWNSQTLPSGVWFATINIKLRASGNATVSSLDYGLYTDNTGLTPRTTQSSMTANETLALIIGQDYTYALSFIINSSSASTIYYFNTKVVWTVATALTGVYTFSYTRIA
jgi:hypothetical protein